MSMNSQTTVTVETVITIIADQPVAAHELAHACGADLDWVAQLVELGLVTDQSAASPQEWRFQSADLQSALEAARLQRDFGVGLDAAALILDLQHEVRRLKGALQALRR